MALRLSEGWPTIISISEVPDCPLKPHIANAPSTVLAQIQFPHPCKMPSYYSSPHLPTLSKHPSLTYPPSLNTPTPTYPPSLNTPTLTYPLPSSICSSFRKKKYIGFQPLPTPFSSERWIFTSMSPCHSPSPPPPQQISSKRINCCRSNTGQWCVL